MPTENQAPEGAEQPTWAGASAFIQHAQNVAGAQGRWVDEYLAWYSPIDWLGEHRAAAVFLGQKLAALAAQPQAAEGAAAAVTTLKGLGYTWHGAEQWQPPLGKTPRFVLDAQCAAEGDGDVLVPLTLLEDASSAIGNFVSDHGWSDEDMQVMDNLDAFIARHKANAAAASKGQPKGVPFLARDVAELLGIGVPELSAALVALGFPQRSQGMTIEPLEALAVYRAQAPAPAQATGTPNGEPSRSRAIRFEPRDGGRRIDDDDFGFDAMLTIDGDFGSDADREAYARFICDKLNAVQAPAVPGGNEPVAWIEHDWSGTGARRLHFERRPEAVRDEVVNPIWTPLYAKPPVQGTPCDMGEICIGCQPRAADGACPYADAAFRDGYEAAQADAKVCQVPPPGWRCTRDAGHDGPCAAVEAPEDAKLVERGMARLREGDAAT